MARMCRFYGKFPHEILALDLVEFNLAAGALMKADADTAYRVKRINQGGGMVFPTVPVTG